MEAFVYTNLTPHFKLSEFLRSDCAALNDFNNFPDWDVYVNIVNLARRLEDVRNIVNLPIFINSGYRSPEVNTSVGGAPNSYHLYGRAVDVRCVDMDKLRYALGKFDWTEYIDYTDFIHIAL